MNTCGTADKLNLFHLCGVTGEVGEWLSKGKEAYGGVDVNMGKFGTVGIRLMLVLVSSPDSMVSSSGITLS